MTSTGWRMLALMEQQAAMTWLGATYGLMGPGWQGSFRVTHGGENATVVVWRDGGYRDTPWDNRSWRRGSRSWSCTGWRDSELK